MVNAHISKQVMINLYRDLTKSGATSHIIKFLESWLKQDYENLDKSIQDWIKSSSPLQSIGLSVDDKIKGHVVRVISHFGHTIYDSDRTDNNYDNLMEYIKKGGPPHIHHSISQASHLQCIASSSGTAYSTTQVIGKNAKTHSNFISCGNDATNHKGVIVMSAESHEPSVV